MSGSTRAQEEGAGRHELHGAHTAGQGINALMPDKEKFQMYVSHKQVVTTCPYK